MSSFFSSYTTGGSKFISTPSTPTGPTSWTGPSLPPTGSTFTLTSGTQKSLSGSQPIFRSSGRSSGGGSSPAPQIRQPTQNLSMGTYDPNTKTFTDSSGKKFSTADPQKICN